MNIENTTDFSSYLRNLETDEREQEQEPEYKVVDKIYYSRDNVFHKWYTQEFNGKRYSVLVYYPDFKSIDDYFDQGLDKDDGVKIFYTERIVRFTTDGQIHDYTDWFQFNHEQEINLASSIDAQSEEFFKRMNQRA